MDLAIIPVMIAVCVIAIVLFYVIKIFVFLGYLFCSSISWHLWAARVGGNGYARNWWNDGESKLTKTKVMAKSLFTMIPELADCAEFSRGLSNWRGIGDWNVGDRHVTNTSEWTVAALMIGFLVGLFWGLPYIARIFS